MSTAGSHSSLYLLLDPDLRILKASDEYLRATLLWNEAIQGCGMFEVFPDNPNDPGDGVSNLRDSFDEVLRTGTEHKMPLQRYDVRDHVCGPGSWVQKFWLPVNYPVFGSGSEEITHVIHEVRDVTRVVQIRRWLREQRIALREQVETLQRMEADLERRDQELQEADAPLGAMLEGADSNVTVADISSNIGVPPHYEYFHPGELSPVSGIFSAHHSPDCPLTTGRFYVQHNLPFPQCPRCGSKVVFRYVRRMD